jgi:hypothetical protein
LKSNDLGEDDISMESINIVGQKDKNSSSHAKFSELMMYLIVGATHKHSLILENADVVVRLFKCCFNYALRITPK